MPPGRRSPPSHWHPKQGQAHQHILLYSLSKLWQDDPRNLPKRHWRIILLDDLCLVEQTFPRSTGASASSAPFSVLITKGASSTSRALIHQQQREHLGTGRAPVPGTQLKAFWPLCHLIWATALWGRFYYYLGIQTGERSQGPNTLTWHTAHLINFGR